MSKKYPVEESEKTNEEESKDSESRVEEEKEISREQSQGTKEESKDGSVDKPLAYNYDKASTDQNIIELRNKLRNFLSQSTLYEFKSIQYFLAPLRTFLNKEYAIFRMKQGWFRECFEICVNEVKEDSFMYAIAEKGLQWHKEERLVYYNLFTRLMVQANKLEGEDKDQAREEAVKVLSRNAGHIPYSKLCKQFEDEDSFTDGLNELFTNSV